MTDRVAVITTTRRAVSCATFSSVHFRCPCGNGHANSSAIDDGSKTDPGDNGLRPEAPFTLYGSRPCDLGIQPEPDDRGNCALGAAKRLNKSGADTVQARPPLAGTEHGDRPTWVLSATSLVSPESSGQPRYDGSTLRKKHQSGRHDLEETNLGPFVSENQCANRVRA